MSRLLRVLVASLLLLPSAVGACGGQTVTDQSATPTPSATLQSDDPTDAAWNLRVDQVSWLEDANAGLQDEVGTAMEQIGQVAQGDFSPEKLATIQTAVAEAKPLIKKMKQNCREIAVLWDEAAKLDVTAEEKTYALQRKEITGLYVRVYTLMGDLVAMTDALLDPSTLLAMSEADYQKWLQDGEDLYGRMGKLAAKIEKKELAADQFAADNGLTE